MYIREYSKNNFINPHMILKYKKYIDIIENTTFVFYDYETFGINTALDKVAQFCSIETDCFFNVINKKTILFCSPPLDYLPDPQSVLITKILPQYTRLYGINEYFFSKKINSLFSKKNICIVGYNNINFDNLITRNLFYRNLFDPYEWSWKNNNFSWDILNILRAFYIFFPKTLLWPHNTNGTISFKLSDITAINQIKHTTIHDAASDVSATISIAHMLYTENKCFFLFLYYISHKKNILSFIAQNYKKPIFYVSSYFGSLNNNLGCISILGFHPRYKNCILVIDLSRNLKELFTLYNLQFKKTITIKQLFSLGVHLIYLNKSPLFFTYNFISLNNCKRLGLDYIKCQKNFFLLQNNTCIITWVMSFFIKNTFIHCDNKDVDLMLYDSFFTYQDRHLFSSIHNHPPLFWNKLNSDFFDNRVKDIFFRLKARNFLNLLNLEEIKRWKLYCQKKLNSKIINLYISNIRQLQLQHKDNLYHVFLLEKLVNYVDIVLHDIKRLI